MKKNNRVCALLGHRWYYVYATRVGNYIASDVYTPHLPWVQRTCTRCKYGEGRVW